MLKLILSSGKKIILLELSFTYFKCMRFKGIEPATWFRSEVTGLTNRNIPISHVWPRGVPIVQLNKLKLILDIF